MPEPSDLLTIAEVAALLHCSKAHVFKIINGQVPHTPPIPAIVFGRRKLVRSSTLQTWIAEREGHATIVRSQIGAR